MRQTPRVLLHDVYWSFAEPVPQSSVALIEAASAYAAGIEVQDPCDALLQRLPVSDVNLKYEYGERTSDGEWKDVESSVRVVGVAHSQLTGADVLWELHVACAATVGKDDHHFFEGLELEEDGTLHEPPTYRVLLGS